MTRLWTMAVLGAMLAGCQATQPSGAANSATMRVMTFNIRYGKAPDGPNSWEHRRDLVAQVFRDHQVDLAGLQEALREQLDEIHTAVPEYGIITAGRNDGKNGGEATPILYRLSRFEILEQGTFWLSDTPEVPGSRSWGNHFPRICTWARLRDRQTGRIFRLFNTHLDHQSQLARERGAELIVQRLQAKNGDDAPAIVMGDFNADEDNPATQCFKGQTKTPSAENKEGVIKQPMQDTFRVLHPDTTPAGTFNGFTGERTGAKIDYIFASPRFSVLDAAIVYDNRDGRYPSDHFPLTTTLQLKP